MDWRHPPRRSLTKLTSPAWSRDGPRRGARSREIGAARGDSRGLSRWPSGRAARSPARARMRVHSCACARMRVRVQTRVCVQTRACVCACRRVYACACTRACMCACTRTCMHTVLVGGSDPRGVHIATCTLPHAHSHTCAYVTCSHVHTMLGGGGGAGLRCGEDRQLRWGAANGLPAARPLIRT